MGLRAAGTSCTNRGGPDGVRRAREAFEARLGNLEQSSLHGDIGAEEADLQHQRRAAAGVASPGESSNAQTELERAEAESQLAGLEVDLINADLGRL